MVGVCTVNRLVEGFDLVRFSSAFVDFDQFHFANIDCLQFTMNNSILSELLPVSSGLIVYQIRYVRITLKLVKYSISYDRFLPNFVSKNIEYEAKTIRK